MSNASEPNLDQEVKSIDELTDRELLEAVYIRIDDAVTILEKGFEQFQGLTDNPKFAMFAKMLGLK